MMKRTVEYGTVCFVVLLAGWLFLQTPGVILASVGDETPGNPGSSFAKVRKIYYNSEAPLSEAKKAALAFRENLSQQANGYPGLYWRAQTEFLLGEITEAAGDKTEAPQFFAAAGDDTQKALKLNPGSADAKRIRADTYMRLMKYKDITYTIQYGSETEKLLREAMEDEPDNCAVHNSLGVYYLNTPPMFGDKSDQAVKHFQRALSGADPFDRFIANVWLGKAYQKRNNPAEAGKYLRAALAIYPNSTWAKRLLNQNLPR